MTEQEHIETSRKLALAIGWKPEQIKTMVNGTIWMQGDLHYLFSDTEPPFLPWNKFDYRDPVIAFRVAEKFDCFPERVADVWWVKQTCDAWVDVEANTPQLAIALAVIAAKGVK